MQVDRVQAGSGQQGAEEVHHPGVGAEAGQQ